MHTKKLCFVGTILIALAYIGFPLLAAGIPPEICTGPAGQTVPVSCDDAGVLNMNATVSFPSTVNVIGADGGPVQMAGHVAVDSLPNTNVSTGQAEACATTVAGSDGGPANAYFSCPAGMNRLMCDAPACVKLNVTGHGSNTNALTACVQGTAVSPLGTRVGDHLPEPWSPWVLTPAQAVDAGTGNVGSDAGEFFFAAEGTSATAKVCCSCQPMP
jgi:hypothetical protein